MGNIGNYEETRRNFRWNVPEDFHFGDVTMDLGGVLEDADVMVGPVSERIRT
jgi:hypothetical protein